MNDLIKKQLKEVVDKCGIIGSDLSDYILYLERTVEHNKKIAQENKELFDSLAYYNNEKVREIIRLEDMVIKMKCCKNCKNKKYLSYTYEFTVCDDCVNCSNWEIKQDEEDENNG